MHHWSSGLWLSRVLPCIADRGLLQAGTLDLKHYTIHTFPLAQYEQALEKAVGLPPFSFAVVEPNA